MVKFRSRADENYQRVLMKIKEIAAHCHTTSRSVSVREGEMSSMEGHFMVPFPKNDDYVGKSQILDFIEGRGQQKGSRRITVALCGLGGTG
jgi:hypothetical protein